jgi:hypothetical protein
MTSLFRSDDMEMRAFSDIIQIPSANLEASIATFAGLDREDYPGEDAMSAYKDAGFKVTCVYLANKPGRIKGGANSGWIGAAAKLASKGWGLAPTYLGAQASKGGDWTPADPMHKAPTDAKEAVDLAVHAGLSAGQTIFLDVEAAFDVGSDQESYVLKWIECVQAKGFKAAIYCFPKQIAWAQKHSINIWTVHLNSHTGTKDKTTRKITWCELNGPLPSDPIDPGAIGTQGRFYCHAAGRKDEIDYDCWKVQDPSQL